VEENFCAFWARVKCQTKGVFLCARETLFYRTTFFSAAAERHLNLPAITY
jgi:hypothetical protein